MSHLTLSPYQADHKSPGPGKGGEGGGGEGEGSDHEPLDPERAHQ